MGLKKLKLSSQLWLIAKKNLRHNFLAHFFISIVIIILTPILFGINNLDIAGSAVPLEIMVSLIGIVLLTPIFRPEQNTEILEVISSKKLSCMYVFIIRTVYSLVGIFALVSLFSGFMIVWGSEITAALIFGTIANSIFLGSLGMITEAISNNAVIGYMIPIVYYAINITTRNKLGVFNLFSMMDGEYTSKIWIFCTAILLIILALIAKRVIIKSQ